MEEVIKDIHSEIHNLRKKFEGKTVGLCSGCFDILHSDHIEHFLQAKKQCDYLIVSVTADKYVNKGSDRPINSLEQRVLMIRSLKVVDFVICNHADSNVDLLHIIRPNFYFKGKQYIDGVDKNGRLTDEKMIVEQYGGKLIFTDNQTTVTTSDIIDRIKNGLPQSFKQYLPNWTKEKLTSYLESYNEEDTPKKFLVVGDNIIDEYCYVDVNGIANKSQAISVVEKDTIKSQGGTKIIYEHINQLYDGHYDTSVKYFLPYDTVYKKRYINKENNQRLFEVSRIDNSQEDPRKFIIQQNVTDLILCDFGHGMLGPGSQVWRYLQTKPQNDLKISLMCQTNSMNYGYNTLRKYYELAPEVKFNLISLDMREGQLFCDSKHADVDDIIYNVVENFDVENVLVTRGLQGITLYNRTKREIYSLPKVGKIEDTVDPIGCGDAAYAAACVFCDVEDKLEAAFYISVAGYMHSKVIGNSKPLDRNSFIEECSKFAK